MLLRPYIAVSLARDFRLAISRWIVYFIPYFLRIRQTFFSIDFAQSW